MTHILHVQAGKDMSPVRILLRLSMHGMGEFHDTSHKNAVLQHALHARHQATTRLAAILHHKTRSVMQTAELLHTTSRSHPSPFCAPNQRTRRSLHLCPRDSSHETCPNRDQLLDPVF